MSSDQDVADEEVKKSTPRFASVRKSGYPVDIFLEQDKIEDFVCAICTDICRDAVETTCTHVFCAACLHTAVEVKPECPLDHTPLSQSQIRNAGFVRRKVLNLRVRCINHSGGCKQLTVLSDLQKHIQTCEYALVECTLCHEVMRLKKLPEHAKKECLSREVNCKYCHATVAFDDLKVHVEEYCQEFVIPCPNECNIADAPRKVIQAHLESSTCRKQLVKCRYYEQGCRELIIREDLKAHLEDAAFHLDLVDSHYRQQMLAMQQRNTENILFMMQVGSLDKYMKILQAVNFQTPVGVVRLIIRGMEIYQEDPYVQERGCYALITSCEVNNANADANIADVVSKGGIKIIVEAMQRHEDHIQVQEYALHVLRKMATNSDVKNFVQQEQSIDIIGQILRTMAKHRSNVGVQRDAIGVLLNMAVNDQIEKRIGRQGGISHILSAMDRYPDSANLEQLACHALFHLTFDDGNKERLIMTGALQRLIDALEKHSRHTNIVYYALRAIAQLAKNDRYRDKMKRLGVAKLAQQALSNHPSHRDLQKKVTMLLARLSGTNSAKSLQMKDDK